MSDLDLTKTPELKAKLIANGFLPSNDVTEWELCIQAPCEHKMFVSITYTVPYNNIKSLLKS